MFAITCGVRACARSMTARRAPVGERVPQARPVLLDDLARDVVDGLPQGPFDLGDEPLGVDAVQQVRRFEQVPRQGLDRDRRDLAGAAWHESLPSDGGRKSISIARSLVR
jgi:hypothetical protein